LDYGEKLVEEKFGAAAKKFLSLPYKSRSEEIGKLLSPPAGGEDGTKERVRDFLNGLEHELHKRIAKEASAREALEDIAKVRSYVNDRSPSLKMLLEHLAVSIPYDS
jgi:hypothetical protein